MTAISRSVVRLGVVLLVVLAFLAALAQGTGPLADLAGRVAAASPAGTLGGRPALAPYFPPLPHAFWGAVTVDGQAAAAGRKIEALGANVINGIPDNPLTTTVAGEYGGPGAYDPKLIVQGDDNLVSGTPLRFYVDDMRAEVREEGAVSWDLTYPFAEGTTTQLNLRLVKPVLRISKLNSTTARLEWDAVAGAASYALYRSTTPYFVAGDLLQDGAGFSYDDVGALGNSGVNYYYQLKVVYDEGKGMGSNRVGEFDFGLTPGS